MMQFYFLVVEIDDLGFMIKRYIRKNCKKEIDKQTGQKKKFNFIKLGILMNNKNNLRNKINKNFLRLIKSINLIIYFYKMLLKRFWNQSSDKFGHIYQNVITQCYLIINIIIGFNFALFYFFYDQNRVFLNKEISKTTQLISHLKVPMFLRQFLYTLFGKLYNLNFQEIQNPLNSFTTFSDFFCRKVKPRFIDPSENIILSPADSKILAVQQIHHDKCSIIKDIKYSLGQLITGKQKSFTMKQVNDLKKNPQNSLYQIIFYLSPGDYHRYHSPVEFCVEKKTQYHGTFYPVHEKGLAKFKKTYQKNQKIRLQGIYKHGYINMIMVGAFNVGNILVHDQKAFQKGEEVGMFKLGSTIVLILEAPKSLKFKIKPGQKVKYGDVICDIQ